jgi:hypothetical protein
MRTWARYELTGRRVPWITAVMSVSEALQACPGSTILASRILQSQPAGGMEVRADADHPIRFAVAWLQLIVGWDAFLPLGIRLKRYP